MREDQNLASGPGRPREFDEAEVLSLIMQIFWEKGYEGTGLSDLVKTTGVKKASLYAAFGNKQSIYLKALEHYEGLMVDSAVKALTNPNLGAFDKVHAFLSSPITAVRANGDRRGCFLCNASADRSAFDGDVERRVQRGYEKMLSALTAALDSRNKKEGNQISSSESAALALSVYSGLRIMARANVSVDLLTAARDTAMKAVFK